jgi:subtilisin family serine protease
MHFRRPLRGLVAVLLAGAATGTLAAGAAGGPAAPEGRRERVIVRLQVAAPGGGAVVDETRVRGSARSQQRARIAAASGTIGELAERLGGRVVHRYHAVPFVAVEVPAGAVDDLEASPAAVEVLPDAFATIADAESTPLVGATATHAAGFDGAGQSIAVLDTGVDSSHPFLAGKVVAEACYSITGHCPNGSTSQTGPGSGVPCTFAVSDCRHGTHVAGIAAGGPANGVDFTGIAPGASIVSVQIFSRFEDPVCAALGEASPCALTLWSDQIAALEFVYDNAATYDIASVNMSIGGFVSTKKCSNDPIKPAVDNLRAIGVATIIAAGNDARTDGLSSPGCIPTAISVGATTEADTIASYSNSAPFMTMWAPGSAIRSSIPGGGYANFNGTSMATPHVAGAFAIARQLYPSDTVSQRLYRFQIAGPRITDPRNGVTKRRLDVLAALRPIVLAPGLVAVGEGDTAQLPLTLAPASSLPVTADWNTLSATAIDGVDAPAQAGSLTIDPGDTAAALSIGTTEDFDDEPDELLLVIVTNPQNAVMGGYLGIGFVWITDDD